MVLREGNKAISLLSNADKLGFRFYGFDEVRYELKAAPRIVAPFESHNFRADLLRLYEALISKEYTFEQRMMDMAVEYYRQFRSLGGTAPQRDIITDFIIVACASLKAIDVLVSDDVGTMFNRYALQSYTEVNKRHSLLLPKFWSYQVFAKEISRLGRITPRGERV